MEITFGLYLDGRKGPSPTNHFDHPMVGRKGFLSLLETYLGLATPEVSNARRVAVYSGLLRTHDNGQRFYSESFKADSIGTAVRLLNWRDEWRLGGWLGNAHTDHPLKIQELAAIEVSAATTLPAGEAERLKHIIDSLQKTGAGPIKLVYLVDPLEDFPVLWRQIIELMPAVEIRLPSPQGSGQLLQIQKQALDLVDGKHSDKAELTHSGTIQLIRSRTVATAEHWLSAYQAKNPTERLLLAEASGDSLDVTLSVSGGVKCGYEKYSQLRPALQALPLALELCWSPLDVKRLIDFLTHPVGPFSRIARTKLARAFARQPGIGGEVWTETKSQLATGENAQELLDQIGFWLESDRWPRKDGMPIEALIARVDRMKEAMRRKISAEGSNNTHFSLVHRQCAAVHEALTVLLGQGLSKILPRQIEQLVSQATASGATNSTSVAEIGCMYSSSNAGACVEPVDEVIWWMPSSPNLPNPTAWSGIEIQALNELGVEVRDPARELTSLSKQWLRPLLAARKNFVLVCPPPAEEVHPIRQLLKKLLPSIEANAFDLDEAIGSTLDGTMTVLLAHQPLPTVPRAIQLSKPINLDTKTQSYTSLNELFNNPALFVLKREAALEPKSQLTVTDDNRLLGILAHRVFEKLFTHADALQWSENQAVEWLHNEAKTLLPTEGAALLMQGSGVSLQSFLKITQNAIISLLNHLRSAEATQVQTEIQMEGSFGDVPLTGKIDILITLKDERTVALDMKWGNENYYAKLLRSGAHLQLALYSSLIEQKTQCAPATLGYFILKTGALYVTDHGIFPNAQIIKPQDNSTITTLLEQANKTWEWRKSQLKEGVVDVVPEDPGQEFQGPGGTLAVIGPSRWDRDHLISLGGWE